MFDKIQLPTSTHHSLSSESFSKKVKLFTPCQLLPCRRLMVFCKPKTQPKRSSCCHPISSIVVRTEPRSRPSQLDSTKDKVSSLSLLNRKSFSLFGGFSPRRLCTTASGFSRGHQSKSAGESFGKENRLPTHTVCLSVLPELSLSIRSR